MLTLWMLTDPGRPALVGELSLASGGQGVGFRYSDTWRAAGYALSEDLPLTGEFFLPPDRKGAPGAVEDARPDRWGERVIRRFERSPRLSVLELLLFAGADRYGALGVSLRADAYAPWGSSPMPRLWDCKEVERWKPHFQASGVRDADLAVLAQYLDNDRLGGQRRQGAGTARSSARRSR